MFNFVKKFLKEKFCDMGIHYLDPLVFCGNRTEYYCKWCGKNFTEFKSESRGII